jgi:Fe2+ or Zn2+ uptake regulation protein
MVRGSHIDQDARLTDALRATGRRVTPQRLILNRALQRIGRHATAEDVMQEAAEQLPNLSLPTVYATLDLLDELGVARRVDAGKGPALYDPRTDGHGHFACRRCGRVVDVDASVDLANATHAAGSAGHRVEGTQVLLVGICSRCA